VEGYPVVELLVEPGDVGQHSHPTDGRDVR
jgi:hypothetical protein